MDTNKIRRKIEHFIDQLCWYNVLNKIDIVTRRSTLDGREAIIIESTYDIELEELIAYTVVHELSRYNDFDLERIESFCEDFDIKLIPKNKFKGELERFSALAWSVSEFPIHRVQKVYELFDQKQLHLSELELPIGWYYGCGDNWHFCAFWHDN